MRANLLGYIMIFVYVVYLVYVLQTLLFMKFSMILRMNFLPFSFICIILAFDSISVLYPRNQSILMLNVNFRTLCTKTLNYFFVVLVLFVLFIMIFFIFCWQTQRLNLQKTVRACVLNETN